MKILLIDDEKLALDRLERILNNISITNITKYQNPLSALIDFKKSMYDVVFLDISMPEINGLELAKKLIQIDENIFIIFQTAYGEHALEAFQSGGIDYLLKPIEEANLQASLNKVNKFHTLNAQTTEKKLLGKNGDTLYLVDIDEVYYIKADLDEVIVRTKEAHFYMRKKIGNLNEILQENNFFRIHRSTIVSVDKIKSMKSIEQSKLQISFMDIEDVVTSSKDGAKEFREYLEAKSL